MSSKSRKQLESWLKTIDVNCNSVIDIGGSQNSIKGRIKSWNVNEYKILDLENPHEDSRKPDIINDLNEDRYPSIQNANRFDIAFCMEVSEYWFNPLQALRNIAQYIRRDGILYISFHFVYNQHPPDKLDYLRYTPNGVNKLLEEAGFVITECKHRLAESDFLEMFYQSEGMRGGKGFNNKVVGSLIKARKL